MAERIMDAIVVIFLIIALTAIVITREICGVMMMRDGLEKPKIDRGFSIPFVDMDPEE
jgi:hypothetical protein